MNLTAILGCVLIWPSIVLADAPSAAPAPSATDSELLTLHAKDQPADAAFALLGKQLGCEFRGTSDDFWDNVKDSPVLTDFDQKPFWDILRELCQQAGVRPVMSGRRRMLLAPDPRSVWPEQPYVIRGPI